MWDSGNCLPTSPSVNPSLCPKWEAYNDPKFLLSSFLSINQTVTGILACVQTTLPPPFSWKSTSVWDSGNCLPTSPSVNPSLCPKWEAYNDPKFLLSSFLSINQTVTGILACVQTTLPSGKIGFFLKGGGICTQATGIWGFKGKWADILNAQDFFDIRELTDWKSSERPYYYKHLYSFPFFKMS